MINNSEKLCGLLGLATRAGKTVVGTEACKIAIERKKVKLVIVAKDASERTKINFKEICKKSNIPIYEVLQADTLSNSIGKENKVIIGVSDINFSKEILKIINGGEVIG